MDGVVRLIAPDLIVYEVANVLRFRAGFSEHALRRDIVDLLDLQLGLLPVRKEKISNAAGIALSRGLTVYDASYVQLAEDRECGLVSCDDRILKTCPRAITPTAWRSPE